MTACPPPPVRSDRDPVEAGPDAGSQARRAGREAELAGQRRRLVAGYRRSWAGMIGAWHRPRRTDAVWLMYAANYLFNTRGLRWAVDPVMLWNRLPETPRFDTAEALSPLAVVLLTHAHADHVDVQLWREIHALGCHWIVPEPMVAAFWRETGADPERVSVARPGRPIVMDGLRVLPFDAPHNEHTAAGVLKPVPATGYLIETGGRRYLLPGDVRTYDRAALPDLPPVDAVFAHLFLGRSAALDPALPLLDAFVRFYQAFGAHKILLTHLYDLAREPEDCWCTSHARQVQAAFETLPDGPKVVLPAWFQEVPLGVPPPEGPSRSTG